jgi:hypothetical protein
MYPRSSDPPQGGGVRKASFYVVEGNNPYEDAKLEVEGILAQPNDERLIVKRVEQKECRQAEEQDAQCAENCSSRIPGEQEEKQNGEYDEKSFSPI